MAMRTRPWALVVLAVIQLLTPVVNLLFNAWIYRVPVRLVFRWSWDNGWLTLMEFWVIPVLAAFAILRMRRWSYALFVVAMLWMLGRHIFLWSQSQGTVSTSAMIYVTVLQLALVTYFLLPAVRTPFFDPRVRWWETKPRFELLLPVLLRRDPTTAWIKATILNLSEGGCFIECSEKLESGDSLDVEIDVFSQKFEARGKVVHAREVSGEKRCYGIQFAHQAESLERFQGLVSGLEAMGFRDRTRPASFWESFRDWLKTLLTSGKGLTPSR